MHDAIIPFSASDNLPDFGLYAYLLDHSKSLTEQVILSYLVSRKLRNPTDEGLYTIPAEHLDGLSDTLGIAREALYCAFRKLEKGGKIALKSTTRGLYARLADDVRMPKEREKFVRIPVVRTVPYQPVHPKCPKDPIIMPSLVYYTAHWEERLGAGTLQAKVEAQAQYAADKKICDRLQKNYESDLKIFKTELTEYPMKLARWRLRCMIYDLKGRPYIMYRIVKAMYSEIGGAGAAKKALRQHKKKKPLQTGAVYGLQGFKQWIGGDDKTLRKAIEAMNSANGREGFPLVWANWQCSTTGYRQQIFTPVPASEYTDDKMWEKMLDASSLDAWCESMLSEQRIPRRNRRAVSRLRTPDEFEEYAERIYAIIREEYPRRKPGDLYTNPEKYGIPLIGMIFLLTPRTNTPPSALAPGIAREMPEYISPMEYWLNGYYQSQSQFEIRLTGQHQLCVKLAAALAGKAAELWHSEEFQTAFRERWAAWWLKHPDKTEQEPDGQEQQDERQPE